MAMPKSTQTRFLGIRDNHNHYTSLHLLFLIIIIIDADSCYPWSVLDLHVGEINVLPIYNFYIIIYDPHATQKASIGMHSGCDYLLCLKILFVCF